jgi:hypothetical protein
MEKRRQNQTEEFSLKLAKIRVRLKERDALQAAVTVLNEQSEYLGLLDAMADEPAILFFAEEGKK